ncbi:MAG: hypothetical protein Unbinned1190contig1000_44 [Prokaryotic dsDNA virus sp.]|mgnify:CR=1 FL=1|nr:MAG: hypothetical protein Unbinned1190contig1000_44 [Prokaryotic dsDNA virus sp.]|tara:strand:- start:4976 stop:6139 length:1164 start_codon:yes stop_codon:yes gene_type:complete
MATLGMRGTGSFAADHRPENWRQKYLMLEPNGSAPLTAVLSMLPSEKTDDPEYHNFRKDLPNWTGQVKADIASGAASFEFSSAADATFARAGQLWKNASTGEIVKISSMSGAVASIVRGVGGGAAGMTANDVMYMIGNVNAEGSALPSSISYDAASTENYTQIFRTPYSISRTAMHTNFRTGDQYLEKSRDALKEHMVSIERAVMFGKKSSDAAALTERTTEGLFTSITTNMNDAASAFTTNNKVTEAEFDQFLAEKAFAYGSSEKLALCGWKVAHFLQQIGKNRWQPVDFSDQSYGISLTTYKTFAGTLQVKTHPMFRQISGFENNMIILDTKDLRYRFVDDTQLLKDRQAAGTDGVTDEYLTECGLEVLQEKTHAGILNWSVSPI